MPALSVPATVTATSLDRSGESQLTALYRAAIGPVNTDYYLQVFERFEAAGRAGPSWNRAACLCTFNWMLFRQMGAAALLYAAAVAGVLLAVLGLGRGLLGFSDAAVLCLLVAFGLLAFVAPGVWGNALLQQHVRKTMTRTLAAAANVPEACVVLNRHASSRQRGVWIALANAVVLGAAVGACIAWMGTAAPGSSANLRAARPPAGVASGALAPAPQASVPLPAQLRLAASAPAAVASAALPTAASASVAAAPTPERTAAAAVTAASAPGPTSVPTAAASASSAISAFPPASASALAAPARASAGPTVAAPSSAPVTARAAAPQATSAAAFKPRALASAPRPARASSSASSRPAPPASSASEPEAASPGTGASDATTSAASSKSPRFYINVGLFAEEANARNAQAKLVEAGLPATTEELDMAKGKRTRVRSGPFDTRSEADAAAVKIRALKLEAVVIRQ